MNASLTIQPARRISTRQAVRTQPPRPVYQAPGRARRQRAARRRHRIAAAALPALLVLFGGLRAASLLLPTELEVLHTAAQDAAILFPQSAAGWPEELPVLEVPALSQADWPTGCESVSAVMALNWAGANLTVEDFVYGYLPMDELWTDAGGRLCGPSPADAFIGDPAGQGYGCFVPVLARAMSQAAPAGYRALDLTGSPLSELTDAYLRHNIPVVIWATMEMRPVAAAQRRNLHLAGRGALSASGGRDLRGLPAERPPRR